MVEDLGKSKHIVKVSLVLDLLMCVRMCVFCIEALHSNYHLDS